MLPLELEVSYYSNPVEPAGRLCLFLTRSLLLRRHKEKLTIRGDGRIMN